MQAAIEQLQHPEQELDALLVRGNGIPQAAIHRAAQGGKETCMKVRRDGVVVQGAGLTRFCVLPLGCCPSQPPACVLRCRQSSLFLLLPALLQVLMLSGADRDLRCSSHWG